jgi:hypothetical protein
MCDALIAYFPLLRPPPGLASTSPPDIPSLPQLSAAIISSKRFERDLEEERAKTAQMERVQKELAEALGEIDKLNGK